MSLNQPPTNVNPKSIIGRGKPINRMGKDGKIIRTGKYTEEQKLFIVSCIGRLMSSAEVKEAFEAEFKTELYRPDNIISVYKRTLKWQPMIQKIRAEYLADIDSVAGAHKRVRVERADRIYNRAYARNTEKSDGVALSAIEVQKREFDKSGNEFNQINILQQQYINMSDEELFERKKYLAEKLKLFKEVPNGDGRIESEVGKSGESKGQ